MTLQDFAVQYERQPITYLAVRYLKNVRQGDKRIIVIDGQVMGASLRLPAEQSWICNVAMGGSSHYTEVAPEEIEIIQSIDPMLSSNGVVMYGVDTLVGDDGKRVLSEINTTSIGGLPQIAQLTGEPIVRRGIDLIVKNVLNRMQ
jgi:glutathione synthase